MHQTTRLPPEHMRKKLGLPRQRISPPKPKRWSHQDDLDAGKEKPIVIIFLDSSRIDGLLLEADQFTMKVRTQGISKFVDEVYFKSAIQGFWLDV